MNLSDKAKQIIGAVAPGLGLVLGGPAGGLAGGMISKALGIDQGDEKAVDAAITRADPDTLLKLRQADNDLQVHLKELGIEADKLVFDDRANARDRQIKTLDRTPQQLAWAIIGGFMVISLAQVISMVAFADAIAKITPQGWLLIGNVSGYLASEAKQCGAFFFGSSLGSQTKDATIADIAKMP